LSADEEDRLSQLQESAEQGAAVRVRYFTLSGGDVAWRHLSVHRILVDGGHVLATCHREGRLEWFRLAGILSVSIDPREPFRPAPDSDIETLLAQSIDGYHSGGPPIRCLFRVRMPEARRIPRRESLPLHTEERADSIVFTVLTAGLLPLAQLIVGLGGAATVETPELRELVAELAMAALAATR
jgi:hypothetical protein